MSEVEDKRADWVKERGIAPYDPGSSEAEQQQEKDTAAQARNNAQDANTVLARAIVKSDAYLDKPDTDPSKVAANLARVAKSSVEQMLQLEGRPTVIEERRELLEIVESGQKRGIFRRPKHIDALEVTTENIE